MEGLLVGSVILLIIGAGILSARLCCYRKQVNHMLSELRILEQEETNLLLTSAVKIGKTQELISSVNLSLIHI
jgi:hypothetical protein